MLGSSAAALEEAKADVMGVWNMLYKVLVEGRPFIPCYSSIMESWRRS